MRGFAKPVSKKEDIADSEPRPRRTRKTIPPAERVQAGADAPVKPARKRVANPNRKPRAKRALASAPPVPRFPPVGWRAARLGAELLALLLTGLVCTLAVLGQASAWFSGIGFTAHLLPFAATVLFLAVAVGGFMRLWLWARPRLLQVWPFLPAAMAGVIAVIGGWLALQDQFHQNLRHLRTMVGGTAEAERTTLAHQVFANYRRSDLAAMKRMMERAQGYLPVIREAAKAGGIDEEVLVGIGAAESSFIPRDSSDGGHGLFQITAPPKAALDFARAKLGIANLDVYDHRHNAYIAVGTLKHYLAQMRGDLFLGLLAYNIGPGNGGLRSIMQQYAARDFVTIQPYLKDLPRDYPIRVLTASLAYRLWRSEGRLPRYEEPGNATRIQAIGVPGLDHESGGKG